MLWRSPARTAGRGAGFELCTIMLRSLVGRRCAEQAWEGHVDVVEALLEDERVAPDTSGTVRPS